MSKDIAPPSYEEVMHTSSGGPVGGVVQGGAPAVGVIYPNVHAIPQPQVQYVPTAPMPPPGYVPTYGAFESTPVNVVVQPTAVTVPPDIIVIGGCPACRIGYLEDSYSCLGLLCAIVFFPVGILCCLAMKTKRCSNCGVEF